MFPSLLRPSTLIVLALFCTSREAWGKAAGITGKSGKQGPTCISCHSGGTAPTVSVTGPTSINAGMSAVYTFVIQTGAKTTGMNVAVTNGIAMTAGSDGLTRLDPLTNEVTQKSPVKPSGGEAAYQFSITAGQYGGKIRLWAAGNACDGNGGTSGDNGNDVTFDIDVVGPPDPNPPDPPPDAGGPIIGADGGVINPGGDASASSSSSSGGTTSSSSGGGTSSASSSGASSNGATTTKPGVSSSGGDSSSEEDTGCAIGFSDRDRDRDSASLSLSGILGALGLIVLRTRQKRRR